MAAQSPPAGEPLLTFLVGQRQGSRSSAGRRRKTTPAQTLSEDMTLEADHAYHSRGYGVQARVSLGPSLSSPLSVAECWSVWMHTFSIINT